MHITEISFNVSSNVEGSGPLSFSSSAFFFFINFIRVTTASDSTILWKSIDFPSSSKGLKDSDAFFKVVLSPPFWGGVSLGLSPPPVFTPCPEFLPSAGTREMTSTLSSREGLSMARCSPMPASAGTTVSVSCGASSCFARSCAFLFFSFTKDKVSSSWSIMFFIFFSVNPLLVV